MKTHYDCGFVNTYLNFNQCLLYVFWNSVRCIKFPITKFILTNININCLIFLWLKILISIFTKITHAYSFNNQVAWQNLKRERSNLLSHIPSSVSRFATSVADFSLVTFQSRMLDYSFKLSDFSADFLWKNRDFSLLKGSP